MLRTWSDLLRLGRLAESWIAPPPLRELRELLRYRHKLVHLRGGLKAQVHSVLAKEGVAVPMSDLFGVGGRRLLHEAALAHAYRVRVESLLDIIAICDREIAMLEKELAPAFAGDLGYQAVMAIPGVGPVLAAIFVAEIGDVSRFTSARTCAAGPGSPRPTESPTKRSVAATSPNRVHGWFAGPPSRRSLVNAAPLRSRSTTTESLSAVAIEWAGSRRHANSSSSSTTAYVTARSVAWPRRGETRDGRSPLRARLASRSPHSRAARP
jgi:hypothetical protein